jgi:cytochrome c5
VKSKLFIATTFLTFVVSLALLASAGTAGKSSDKDAASASAPANAAVQDDPMRFEGEKRFHANCGRCHSAPPRFAPRMMATIVRHMRVRATITDDDMHMILHYMTR